MTPTAQNDVDTGKASNTSQHLCAASTQLKKHEAQRVERFFFFERRSFGKGDSSLVKPSSSMHWTWGVFGAWSDGHLKR